MQRLSQISSVALIAWISFALLALLLFATASANQPLLLEGLPLSPIAAPDGGKKPLPPDPRQDPWALGATGIYAIEVPKALIVVAVAQDSPADRIIKVDDFITKAGSESFASSPKRGFLRALSDAQDKAPDQKPEEAQEAEEPEGEATRKASLELTLTRGDQELTFKLEITRLGSPSDFHKEDNARAAAMLKGHLDWLQEHEEEDEGVWKAGLSWRNGVTATAAMAGLAMLSQGDKSYRPLLARTAEWMVRNVNGSPDAHDEKRSGVNWNQDNWAWSMAALFLSEYWRVSQDDKVFTKLGVIAENLIKNQELSGGWGHGPGGKNVLNYLEFSQMTLQCLAGLQAIKACGVKVAEEPLKLAREYVLATMDSKGGVGYSIEKPGSKGYSQTGRTALAALVFSDLEDHAKEAKKMRAYLYDNRNLAREGHASALMHVVWQCLALERIGGEGARLFYATNRWFFEASYLHDGAGAAQPNNETLKTGSNFDRQQGEAWSTACLALALASRHKRLALQGAKVTPWSEEKRIGMPDVKRPDQGEENEDDAKKSAD